MIAVEQQRPGPRGLDATDRGQHRGLARGKYFAADTPLFVILLRLRIGDVEFLDGADSMATQAERREKTKAAIIKAAKRIFGERGFAAMAAGTQGYFAVCSKGPTDQIILRDGPAVLGWERWREIDAKHFGGEFPRALAAAMEAGIIAKQPIEPLAPLLLGSARSAPTTPRALRSLLDALRVK